jgi:hypothetical protein
LGGAAVLRKNIVVGSLTLAIFIIVSVLFWLVFTAIEYRGIPNTDPWTPFPTQGTTSTIVAALAQGPTLTATPVAKRTNTVVPTLDPLYDCTYSVAYWGSFPDQWPVSVHIANFTYTSDMIFTVYQSQSDELSDVLLIQLNSAYLNGKNGADDSTVSQTMINAANWLELHPAGNQLTQTDQQTGNALVTILADYNDGRLGPGSCADDVTPMPATETMTITPTSAPTKLIRATRTPIITKTPIPTRPRPTARKTNTPRPTTPPTEPPPTSAPLPTTAPTIPPPTPAPTSAPLPTPASN